MAILLIDSNTNYAKQIQVYLENNDYIVDLASSSAQSIEMFKHNQYDLIICDTIVDSINGFQIIETFQSYNKDIKFVILTNSNEDDDEFNAFSLKVDDYINKSSSFRVILKRLSRILANDIDHKIELVSKCEDLKVDLLRREVYKDSKIINLTVLQYNLLVYLLSNKNQVIEREKLVQLVWKTTPSESKMRNVDTFIKVIRKKLGINSIQSIRGVGYRWDDS